jgi:hypothetical protein
VTGASRFLIGLVLDLFRPCGIRQRGVGVPLAERWPMGRERPAHLVRGPAAVPSVEKGLLTCCGYYPLDLWLLPEEETIP